jgi:hypothetical protein
LLVEITGGPPPGRASVDQVGKLVQRVKHRGRFSARAEVDRSDQ